MARFALDIDNISCCNTRGTRYDIVADGIVIYHDVCEDEVDCLVSRMESKPYLYSNIEVIAL